MEVLSTRTSRDSSSTGSERVEGSALFQRACVYLDSDLFEIVMNDVLNLPVRLASSRLLVVRVSTYISLICYRYFFCSCH